MPTHVPPYSTAPDISHVPSSTFIQSPSSSYVLQTVNPNVCSNTFSCHTDKFVSENLNLIRPHFELAPNTDRFVILNTIFDTYKTLQNLLKLLSNDTHTLTMSTIPVYDFLKKLILLETPSFSASS